MDLVAKNALEAMEKADLEKQKKAMTEGAAQSYKRYWLYSICLSECFDISNTQGTESAVSMVVLKVENPKGPISQV